MDMIVHDGKNTTNQRNDQLDDQRGSSRQKKLLTSAPLFEKKRMNINLNIKIKGGPRTPVDVIVYGTAINPKVMKFKNGKTISDDEISVWLQYELTEMLTILQHSEEAV